jgi:hypothetical protein
MLNVVLFLLILITSPGILLAAPDLKQRETVAQKLERVRSKNQLLKNELISTRERLIAAETEIERLSYLMKKNYSPQIRVADKSNKGSAKTGLINRQIVVKVKQLQLRSGAGETFAPLMNVRSGAKLTVVGEKQGWLQVVTEDQIYGWINSQSY